ncbi:glycosyltransferase family protein [Anaerocolumna xylanovorans]|uniref:Glycosyltransferase involved in cell wall bisynthesis n=1 Tax=Anaerocolumna xylanovorans DSM 12503 TaxID=1121345 RepID=A0A1M7Y1K6_9FIRM|nr:glycosyltransferase [Anaerocolumna xylanovorans]SHO45686.1 Glycosyltransferase involved in cell wall bisynthesis [Anaerocolumna xylanovorans DSM 12503]
MRVLVLTEEIWNDGIYPGNVMTNWFMDFPGTLANLYLASGEPNNPCCSRYYQITDKMAARSLITKKGTGKWFFTRSYRETESSAKMRDVNRISNRVIKNTFGGTARLCRDFVWLRSDFKDSLLMDFLEDFRPEVIFSLRFYSRRMLYMERLLHSVTGAPVITFTGDDEYSLRQLNFSPFYWTRKLLFRRDLRRTASIYTKYLTLSERQAKEMEEDLGVPAGILRKGGQFTEYSKKEVTGPIRIIYAGRLYCNRNKTLAAIAEALAAINEKEVLITLEIYTRDKVNKKEQRLLCDDRSVFLRDFVSQDELKKIYKESDIALLTESFDLKNRLLTKYSFSTKVVDCLASSCAVLAIGPYENEGIRYLKKNKAAICIGKQENILPVLSHFVKHPDKIEVYQRRAWELGQREHQKEKIKDEIKELFDMAVNDNKNR